MPTEKYNHYAMGPWYPAQTRPDVPMLPVPCMSGEMPPQEPDEDAHGYVCRINVGQHIVNSRMNEYADALMPTWRDDYRQAVVAARARWAARGLDVEAHAA